MESTAVYDLAQTYAKRRQGTSSLLSYYNMVLPSSWCLLVWQ